MKRICIPLELNYPEEERKTVLYAAALAKDLNMGLTLICSLRKKDHEFTLGRSVEEAYSRHDPAELPDNQEELMYKTLRGYQREIAKQLQPSPPVEVHILRNRFARKQADSAKDNETGFFLMNRRDDVSRSVWPNRKLHSQIADYRKIPVFMHPPGHTYKPVRRILYGTNYHAMDPEVLKSLSGIFAKTLEEIIALHITRDLDFEKKVKQAGYLKLIRSETNNKNITINTMITRDKTDVAANLFSIASGKDADMIVILRERKNLIKRALKQDVINRLATGSDLPLMIFPGS